MIKRKLKQLLIIILVMMITIINITEPASHAATNPLGIYNEEGGVQNWVIEYISKYDTILMEQLPSKTNDDDKRTLQKDMVDGCMTEINSCSGIYFDGTITIDELYDCAVKTLPEGAESDLAMAIDVIYLNSEGSNDNSSDNNGNNNEDNNDSNNGDNTSQETREPDDIDNLVYKFIDTYINCNTADERNDGWIGAIQAYIRNNPTANSTTLKDVINSRIRRGYYDSYANDKNLQRSNVQNIVENAFNSYDNYIETEVLEPREEGQGDDAGIFAKFIDGLAGLIFYPLKVLPALLGAVLLGIVDATTWENLTLYNILFNQIELTKIDFFSPSSDSTVSEIRDNVAVWYVGIRNVAAVLLALILIYVAIRMAMSTVAEDKAKYKKMFIDWAVSLCLLFVLHYIMIFVININNAFVNVLSKAANDTNMDSVLSKLFKETFSLGFVDGIGSSICYMMLVGVTFIFFFAYIKRMITIAFLIIISPLITVTYSIDKMGDGKSQALNTWLKEFVYNVLIQPFQCIIYLSLVSTVLKLVTEDRLGQSLINVFIAVYVIMFMFKAEDIIKKIFGFESESMGKTIASAAITSAIISRGSGLLGNSGSKKSKPKEQPDYRRRPRRANDTGAEEPVRGPNGGGTGQGGTGGNRQGGTGGNGPGGSGGNGGNGQNGNGGNGNGGNAPNGNGGNGNGGNGSNGNGGNGNNGSNNNNPRNSIDEKKAMRKQRVGKLIKGWARLNIAGAARLAGLGLGLSTGDLSTGIAGLNLGATAAKKINNTEALNSRKSEQKIQMARIANAVDDYQDKYGYSNNQVLQNTQDWLDGISTPDRNDEEGLKLYRQMNNLKQQMKESGMSNDDIREQLDALIKNCLSGEQSRINR